MIGTEQNSSIREGTRAGRINNLIHPFDHQKSIPFSLSLSASLLCPLGFKNLTDAFSCKQSSTNLLDLSLWGRDQIPGGEIGIQLLSMSLNSAVIHLNCVSSLEGNDDFNEAMVSVGVQKGKISTIWMESRQPEWSFVSCRRALLVFPPLIF